MTREAMAEAVASWTRHYEAHPEAARKCVDYTKAHGIREQHRAEILGATLALTPRQWRCAHWGDRRNCTQCLNEHYAGFDQGEGDGE